MTKEPLFPHVPQKKKPQFPHKSKKEEQFRSWFDLTSDEQLAFARKVKETKVQGWDVLKQAAWDFGFEPTEDMPSVYELVVMAGVNGLS